MMKLSWRSFNYDKRTVMEYFMEPIIKGFGDSMKEN